MNNRSADPQMQWQELLGRLRLPRLGKIDLRELCRRTGDLIGRDIRLVPMDLSGQVSGLWLLTTTGTDYIAFEHRLAPVHQATTILHEIAHALCGHSKQPVIDTDATATLWPALLPDLVTGVLNRDHADSPAEREAEYLATLLAEHTRWTADLTCPDQPRSGHPRPRPSAVHAVHIPELSSL